MMTKIRHVLAGLFVLALACGPALAQCPSNDAKNLYWIVGDTNPTTNVFGATRGFVPNSDGTYLQWLSSSFPCFVAGGNVRGAASNGGAAQLQLDSTANLQTGQQWHASGTALYDGNWPIQVDDATHITLIGSTFTSPVSSGQLSGPAIIATAAALYQFINQYNVSLWAQGAFSGVNNIGAIVSDTTLTNPMQAEIILQNNAGGVRKLILPPMNVIGSIPKGMTVLIYNTGGRVNANIQLVAQDGSTVVTTIVSGTTLLLQLYDNSSLNGLFTTQILIGTNSGAPLLAFLGGLGTATVPGSAQLPVGDGTAAYQPKTMAGDCINDASFNVTCTKTNGTPFASVATSGSAGDLGTGTLPNARLNTDVALLDAADQTITGGANVTTYDLGTVSSGTTTPDCGQRPLQKLTNNGAFTLAAPANDGFCIIEVTNGASAGAITFSGWTVGSNTGDAYSTTNTNKYDLFVRRINGHSSYQWSALQ